MKQLKRILVPIDFAASSGEAVEQATALAKKDHAEIHLLHVVEDTQRDPSALEQLERHASDQLHEMQRQLHRSGVESAVIVDVGRPYEQIVMRAEALDVDLILMSSRGCTVGERALGFTAEKVACRAHRSVWIVKDGCAGVMHRILCAVDFSQGSRAALEEALRRARDSAGTPGSPIQLTILHVVTEVANVDAVRHPVAENRLEFEKQQQRQFAAFLDSFNLSGVVWRQQIRYGKVDEEIERYARDIEADLLLLGSSPRTGAESTLMGSSAERVMRDMPCSVIVVRANGVGDLPLQQRLADVESHYDMGRELLREGRAPLAAIRQFEYCVLKDLLFAPAYESMAEGYDLMGLPAKAEEYREQARFAHQKNWERKVEAEIHSKQLARSNPGQDVTSAGTRLQSAL